jgi:Flp pilus assembly protein TadB
MFFGLTLTALLFFAVWVKIFLSLLLVIFVRFAIAVILLVVQCVIDCVQLFQDFHHDFDGVLDFLYTDDCHCFTSISAFWLLYL